MKYRIVHLRDTHFEFFSFAPARLCDYKVQRKWLCFWLLVGWASYAENAREMIEEDKKRRARGNEVIYSE